MPFDWKLHEIVFGVSAIALGLFSGGHALLNKREPRAALGWLVVCVGWPLLGPLAYWLFGKNRIQTRAKELSQRFPQPAVDVREAQRELSAIAGEPGEFVQLARIARAVTGRPLLGGNLVRPLRCAEEAFPEMIAAIRGARRSVRLASYIFDNDGAGREFADALAESAGRGVDVKVLLDGVGEFYSLPRIGSLLRKRGVDARRFLPPSLVPPSLNVNLRNHRKILVVDSEVAFTGGMNISDRHYVARPRRVRPVVDLHFRVEGPVVRQMEGVFLEDWTFVTGDVHVGPLGFPPHVGALLCRAISDGPNEDIDKLKWIVLGAISTARESVRIMTPYFLPDLELTAVLNAAALRGVKVEILLPEKLDIPIIAWACSAHLPALLRFGVVIRWIPPPFVHTKLLIVDGHYSLIGSANLDPRSLRLNFEFNLEIYGGECSSKLVEHFEAACAGARTATEEDLAGRSLAKRLRDSAAALFSPYL